MYKTDERGTCMYMVHTSTFFPCRRALFARLKGMAFSPEPRFSKHLQNTSIVPTVPLIWIKNLSSIPGCYVFESRTSTYWLENIFLSFQIKWFRPELAVPLFYPHNTLQALGLIIENTVNQYLKKRNLRVKLVQYSNCELPDHGPIPHLNRDQLLQHPGRVPNEMSYDRYLNMILSRALIGFIGK